ncbi:MAG: hypothetical protein R2824_08440 [Saprospiraceae bacterium]|nr:hypothetical protein [Lewinella sp.]
MPQLHINEVEEKLNKAFSSSDPVYFDTSSNTSFGNQRIFGRIGVPKARIEFGRISDVTWDSFTVNYRLTGLKNEEELWTTRHSWKADLIKHLNRKRPLLLRPFIKIKDVEIGRGSITLALVVTVLTGFAALLTIIVHLVNMAKWIKSYPKFS